jgi:hypothetical protein
MIQKQAAQLMNISLRMVGKAHELMKTGRGDLVQAIETPASS